MYRTIPALHIMLTVSYEKGSNMSRNIKSNHDKWKEKSNKKLYKEFKGKNKVRGNDVEIDYDNKSYLNLISERLKLPGDILTGVPIITATGKNQLCIENYKGIIEYTSEIIKIHTKCGKICIEGKNLNIDYFTNDEMRVSGCLHTIQYS